LTKNALILGAGGFIGTVVNEHFRETGRFSVTVKSSGDVDLSDRPNAALVLGEHTKGAIVIFCAGRHRQRGDSYEIMLENIAMVQSLIDAAIKATPSHLIFLSSVEVYGAPEIMPITEETDLHPRSLYAVGKITCEMMIRHYAERGGVPLSILRLPGIFGPNDDGTSIISKLIAASRGEGVFKLLGDGSDLRDYVSVGDLAEIILCIADNGKSVGTLNIATGNSLSLNHVINLVENVHGPIAIEYKASDTSHFDLVFDTGKLFSALPGFSFSDLMEGVKGYA